MPNSYKNPVTGEEYEYANVVRDFGKSYTLLTSAIREVTDRYKEAGHDAHFDFTGSTGWTGEQQRQENNSTGLIRINGVQMLLGLKTVTSLEKGDFVQRTRMSLRLEDEGMTSFFNQVTGIGRLHKDLTFAGNDTADRALEQMKEKLAAYISRQSGVPIPA